MGHEIISKIKSFIIQYKIVIVTYFDNHTISYHRNAVTTTTENTLTVIVSPSGERKSFVIRT